MSTDGVNLTQAASGIWAANFKLKIAEFQATREAYVLLAAVSETGGITSASNTVTFGISGPGKIIAVDSGINTGESFRGTQRNAFGGICFAIIRATGAGSITVSASASGLTGASVTVQSIDGPFVP